MACSDLISLEDQATAKLEVAAVAEFVESNGDTFTTPDGTTKRTITGVLSEASDAIASINEDVTTVDSAKNVALAQIEGDLATVATEVNTINDSVAAAANSEANAAVSEYNADASALLAVASANFKGKWSSATGTSNIPASYWHDGNNWQQNVDITDITTSEPSSSNEDWQIIVTPALTKPVVYLPFGNKTVDAVNGYFNFDRDSDSSYKSISGYIENLGFDEYGVTSDGIGIYDETTNLILNSEDFSDYALSFANEPTDSGIKSPVGSNFWLVESTAAGGLVQNNSATDLDGDGFNNYSTILRKGLSDNVVMFARIGSTAVSVNIEYEFSTDTVTITGDETGTCIAGRVRLEGGAVRLWAAFNSGGTGDEVGRIYIRPSSTVASTLYATAMQITQGKALMPYIKTDLAQVSKSEDIATIAIKDNMPINGDPWTFVFDTTFPVADVEKRVISQANSFYVRITSGSRCNVSASDASGTVRAVQSSYEIDSEKHRFAVVFTGFALSIYIDGEADNSVTCSGLTLDATKDFYIGSYSGQSRFLNSEIKEFKIYHSALSGAEIASLGGAK